MSSGVDHRVAGTSTEFVKVQVEAFVDGDPSYNPTSDSVQMAFVPINTDPASGDFKTASWETQTIVTPNGVTYLYFARCLIGPSPGTGQLAVGVYQVFVKVTDSPEVPIKYSGLIEVF